MRFFARRIAVPVHVLAVAAVLVQCSSANPASSPPSPATSSPVGTPSPSIAAPPSTSTPQAPPAPAVLPVTAADLGTTWRPGCPVEPAQLRRVDVDYLGFDGQTHRGHIVVHEDLVPDVIAIFGQLQLLRYPIDKIQTVDHYADANDELSMEDNNTSAFNCRLIPGSNDWSTHAYGRAIDINTLLNPCLYATGYFEPQNAGAYLDRTRTDPGVIHDGDPAERVFTERGWQWGGYWLAADYQHFERP